MKTYLIPFIITLFFLPAFFSCTNMPQPVSRAVMGWAPVYSRDSALLEIRPDTPHSFNQPGKIIAAGHFIYQEEPDSGIHVIDISNPAAPVQVIFLRVGGIADLTAKGNYLYTNNFGDLIVLDITNPAQTKEIFRVPNGFNPAFGFYPPGHGYFECVNPSKGIVTGWEWKEVSNPKCYR